MTSKQGQSNVGKHAGCGGMIVYHFTPSIGYRVCLKCKQTSMRGVSPNTEEEVSQIERGCQKCAHSLDGRSDCGCDCHSGRKDR